MLIAAGIECPYPGTNAAVVALASSGWTRSTPMDDRYAKGTAAGIDPDVTGGATTHTHVDPTHSHSVTGTHSHAGFPSGAPSPTGTIAHTTATGASSTTHTHTGPASVISSGSADAAAGTWSTGSNDPSYYTVIWIKSDGTPTGFPSLAWTFWDKVASLPTGWSNPAAARNVFLRGAAAAGDGGGTGGGAHLHSGIGHTHPQSHAHNMVGSSGVPSATVGASSGGANFSLNTHTHNPDSPTGPGTSTLSSTSGDAGSTTYEPSWAKLAVVQNDTGGVDIQLRHVAVWRGLLSAIPANWTLCDGSNSTVDMRGKHVKGANGVGEIGNTGGTVGHSHSDPSTHTHATDHAHYFSLLSDGGGAPNNAPGSSGAPVDAAQYGHSHAAALTSNTGGTSDASTQTAPSNADTQPPFRTTAFISLLSDIGVTITAPVADAVLSNPQATVTWTFTGGSGTQNDYRVKVYESDQTTVRYDSGQVASAVQTITLPAAANLANNSSYYIEITLHDTSSPARIGVSAKRHVTTSWTPPATITGLRAGSGITSEVDPT